MTELVLVAQGHQVMDSLCSASEQKMSKVLLMLPGYFHGVAL